MIDCVSAQNYRGLLPAVRPGGRGASITPPLADGLPDNVTSHAVQSSGDHATLENVVQLANDGILTGSRRKVFDLDNAQAAFNLLLTGHGRGKIIVRPNASVEHG